MTSEDGSRESIVGCDGGELSSALLCGNTRGELNRCNCARRFVVRMVGSDCAEGSIAYLSWYMHVLTVTVGGVDAKMS